MPRADTALPLRHAVALGLLQGPTELLPISSSAHTALLPWFARWPYHELDPELRKGFEVALHTGAALALALSMRRELMQGVSRSPATLIAVVALASAPPALVGLAFGRAVERRLGAPAQLAAGLAAGAVAMAIADAQPPRDGGRSCEHARLRDGVALGVAQATALVPGVSRSGATLTAARSRGFSRASAHALCWAVALPVMSGASVLQGARVLRAGVRPSFALKMLAGLAAAFCSTLASAALLRGSLSRVPLLPFALYRCLLAVAVLGRANRVARARRRAAAR